MAEREIRVVVRDLPLGGCLCTTEPVWVRSEKLDQGAFMEVVREALDHGTFMGSVRETLVHGTFVELVSKALVHGPVWVTFCYGLQAVAC